MSMTDETRSAGVSHSIIACLTVLWEFYEITVDFCVDIGRYLSREIDLLSL